MIQLVKVYEQLPLIENDSNGEEIKGWLFKYADIYNHNTCSTERKDVVWIEDEIEAKHYFLRNRKESF